MMLTSALKWQFCLQSTSRKSLKLSKLKPLLLIYLSLLLTTVPRTDALSIRGPFLTPKRSSIPFEGFRSKGGIISSFLSNSPSFSSPSTHSTATTLTGSGPSLAPASKFRDAISGYSVNLDEEEAKRLLRSKLSLYSSSLNVLDGQPEDTELAHSILLVHKKKPNVNTTITSLSSSNGSPNPSSSPSPVPVVFSLLPSASDTSPINSFASPLNYYSTSDRTDKVAATEETPSSHGPISSSTTTTTTVRASDVGESFATSTTSTTTTESSASPPPTVKFSAHTFKPFSVTSSLNYGPSLSPPSSSSMKSSSSSLKLKLKTPSSSSLTSGGTFVFGNFTQISSFDPTYNPNRPPLIVKQGSWTTKRRPIFSQSDQGVSEDEMDPIVVHSNHRKTFLSRQKVTSASDAWTTPSSFTEVPTRTSTHNRPTIPSTLYPPYTTSVTSKGTISTPSPSSSFNVASRPPLKVTAVHSNRNKPPDRIQSGSMTVLDSKGNVTIVHQKLIVPYKPGRPKPGVSSVGTIQAPPAVVRPKPNTTDSGEVIEESGETEATTYYPQGMFKPTTAYPPRPWTCEPICGSSQTTLPPTRKPITTTTRDPFLAVESAHVIATRRPPFQPATVNAILAPPMPSRPISTPAPIGNTGIFSSLLGVLGVDSTGGLMSRLTLLKTALFTLLVMFLPPLTLAAAVAQLL